MTLAILGHSIRIGVLGACLLLGSALETDAQEIFQAWVGLYDSSQTAWLENENRIGDLCPDSSGSDNCYSATLAPSVYVYSLHAEPDDSSAKIGELIVVAVPGRGLSSYFRSSDSPESIPFSPDLVLQDWGYGPYFHQTFSRQRGNWFELPPDPWQQAVWLRRDHDPRDWSIITVSPGDILDMHGNGMYVVSTETDALTLRPEQPGDLWCEEGIPPVTTPAEPVRFSRRNLVDSRGHLTFRPKYLKGC